MPEAPGPPCARCDKQHPSADCPDYNQRRTELDASSWLTSKSLDQTLLQIVEHLRSAANGTPGRVRQFVAANDSFSDGTGHHWFTVAYEVA